MHTLSNQTPEKNNGYIVLIPTFFPGFCRSRYMIHPDLLPGAHPSFGSGLHGGTMGCLVEPWEYLIMECSPISIQNIYLEYRKGIFSNIEMWYPLVI